MKIVHLTASTFLGGPERQMLGLAQHLPRPYESYFLSFAEGGRCRSFLTAVRHAGFEGAALQADTPHIFAATREIGDRLQSIGANVLLCHGYKADLLGRRAARSVGIPVVAVSRGWTGECFRVRLYERLDRFLLRWMDRVVCVSAAQADKVRRARVAEDRIRVIHNAIDPDRFAETDRRHRAKLLKYFRGPKTRIVGAAGRLSPEKGMDVLVAAAEEIVRDDPSVGFVVFGEGAERPRLFARIKDAGLMGSFVLAGFRNDLDRFISALDVLALPSHTEGLPNVALEACAANVPVVATRAGGTPEVIEDGVNGLLVPTGDVEALAARLRDMLASEERRHDMGLAGRQKVVEEFSFTAQADQYCRLLDEVTESKPAPTPPPADPEPDFPPEYGDPVGSAPPVNGEVESHKLEELAVTGTPCQP
jgi:glycosyltransferase involved in cell wall biosynthesis